MAWTDNLTVAAGETSTGLIVGNSNIADAVASNVYVSGTANDFIISHGGILRAQAGGVTNNAQITGTAQAQEIKSHAASSAAKITFFIPFAAFLFIQGCRAVSAIKSERSSVCPPFFSAALLRRSAPHLVQRCRMIYPRLASGRAPTGSIAPPQGSARSPGLTSTCKLHRQNGQWLREV